MRRVWGRRVRVAAIAAVVVAAVAVGIGYWSGRGEAPVPAAATGQQAKADESPTGGVTFERVDAPARTIVRDAGGAALAVFTDGARTVVVNGAKRTFAEPQATDAVVNTAAWVRLAPQPWAKGAETADWFAAWWKAIRADTSPDVLATAFEYVIGAPDEKDAAGVRFRGDASFGPIKPTGVGRQEQSDFYDYLGVPWDFPDGRAEKADPGRYGSIDCSGYIRLVYGYRMGLPLLGGNEAGSGLPRRAYAISEFGPGVQLVRNTYARAVDYGVLQPGDLVFFEVEDDPETLDHVGVYIGLDSKGHHRFISSRERINGPTFGDVGGTSLLDDGGHYSNAWRAARRL